MAIPKEIKREHVLAALEYIDKNKVPAGNESYRYDLVGQEGGKRKPYPPKYVIAVARHLATGEPISTKDFNAIEAKNWLNKHKFQIEEKPVSAPPGDIEMESEQSKRYRLDTKKVPVTIRGKPTEVVKTLVELTLDNVGKVEAMIENDSDYIRASDPNAGPYFNSKGNLEYSGSTPFWMSLLKKALNDTRWTPSSKYGHKCDRKDNIGFTFEEIIAGAIVAVDRDNSTHLTGDGVGRIEIWNRICKIRDKLKDRLRRRDFKLVDEIMAETDPGSKNKREQLNDAARKRFFHKWLFEAIKAKQETKKQNKEFKSRTNQSFASKFCHYACLYVFKGNKEADNFSIYDKILETVLPWYWSRFKVGELKKSGKFNYEEYSEVIDEIRIENSKNGYMISRNGLDHLLWYYHKGRLKQDNDPQKMQQVSPG